MKGYCRRHAPKSQSVTEEGHALYEGILFVMWPLIQDAEKDWCGEFERVSDRAGLVKCATCYYFEEIKETAGDEE